jgi:hypothetical protein
MSPGAHSVHGEPQALALPPQPPFEEPEDFAELELDALSEDVSESGAFDFFFPTLDEASVSS